MISSNSFLNHSQQVQNASELLPAFRNMGWSDYAIAGIFGNLQTESTFNPGIWQDLKAGRMDLGYGLVQWTPASKYITWCNQRGWSDYGNYEHQLARLQWELDNRQQWFSTSRYPMSFRQFIVAKPNDGESDEECVKRLAAAFVYNYERPKVLPQPARGNQAWSWWLELGMGGEQPIPPPDPPEPPPDPPSPPVEGAQWKYIYFLGGKNIYLGVDSKGGKRLIEKNSLTFWGNYIWYDEIQFAPVAWNMWWNMAVPGIRLGTVKQRDKLYLVGGDYNTRYKYTAKEWDSFAERIINES